MGLSEDQKLINKFIDDLVNIIVSRYANKIDFIILYGSAARGEFIKGVSDIDLLIQTKKQVDVQSIKEFSYSTFWDLDIKYKLGFRDYLASAKSTDFETNILRKIENEFMLYTPLFVLGPNDLDWEKAEAKKIAWRIPTSLFFSTKSTFFKFKTEGKILYGRDIRKIIPDKPDYWDRWKGLWIPFYLSTASVFLVWFIPKSAVKYSQKAILWNVDSALTYLGYTELSFASKYKKLKNLTTSNWSPTMKLNLRLISKTSYRIVEESLKYKKHGFKGGYLVSISYVLRSFGFIIRLIFTVKIQLLSSLLPKWY